MDNHERLEGYLFQAALRGGQLAYEARDDSPLLKPGMRRRLRHKRHGRKTHDHASLPMLDEEHRQPCSRCRPPAPQRQPGDPRGYSSPFTLPFVLGGR